MFSSPLHFVIGIIAILKAGGAYVPIDPDLPISRLQYILDDIKAYIILVDSLTGDKIPSTFARIICLDESQKLINQSSPDNLSLAINSSQLAYVIYTSGTTGKAKGVMIEHQGVVSLATADYVMIGIEDICIQLSDMSFDAATFEIWSILLNGAGLLMLEEPNKLIANTDCLQQKLIEESITIMWLTRSLFDQLYLLNKNLFKSLNYLLVGGEALNKKLISELLLSDTRPKHLINGYGPTENTTFSCTYNIESKGLINSANVSIGRPISNRKAYILTNDMNPSPIGAIGELYVGGAGLARGYLNNTALTKERFILNPYQTSEEKNLGTNKNLYKTGDIARWLSEGNIEYIGRKDFQVKIRGYRIELGEIESVLLNYQGIDQCVALLKESKLEDDVSENKYLVAYYVSHKSLSEEDIFSYLRRTLPEYMIPNSLVYLENLPLTVNGKLDIKALPEHNLTNEKQYVAPRNDIEKIICTVWGECLGILSEKIGIHDDFFMLGGNSLLAIKIISKMRSNANLDISIMDLFQYKTIALILSNHSIKQNNINKESESKLYEEFHV
ncbi:MAG: amino acid adenylation domain-containing protein [Alphaproteobacteria bacterium]|nr:amino acid adenylation domain-containing protein [Alphaproteobacteria bacterium]